jgi:hypothetical protein
MYRWRGFRAGVVGAGLAFCVAATGASALAQDARPAAAAAVGSGPGAVTDARHRQDDIGRHRTIAAAHEAAARCLERGEKESACHEVLRKACQGIAVGRYCGMKHSH